MVRYILVILIAVSICEISFCKGGRGEYVIAGTAFDRNNRAILNGLIYVAFNGRKDSVKTNASGQYSLLIPWQTVCPSFYIFNKFENNKLNPESIYFTFQEDEIKVKNNWEEYNDKASAVKMDLRFGNHSTVDIKTTVIYTGLVLFVAGLFFFLLKRKAYKRKLS